MVGHDGRIDVVVVGGTVLVINNPNSANRLMWKSFWDSTAGREEGQRLQRLPKCYSSAYFTVSYQHTD